MPKLLGLRCRECGAEYPLQATHVCEMCFGPLDAVYDYAALKKVVTRERIESGPKSIWRYRDLLPVEDSTPVVTLGEGFTPLVKADRLGQELGLRNLYLKNDSMNPTNSFKDRVVSVAISWARSRDSRRWRARRPETWPMPWPRTRRGRAWSVSFSSRSTSSRRRS